MSSHEKALEKKKKHVHSKGEDGKCKICDVVMEEGKDLDEKGKRPRKEKGDKNNDSEED